MKFLNKHIKVTMLFFVAVAGLSLLLSGNNVFAASKTWSGGGSDGKWSTASNWTPSGAPTSGDDLTFDYANTTANTPTNDITGLNIHSITFTGGTTGNLGSIVLAQPTTISGDITNSGAANLSLSGGFTLGANVKTIGHVDLMSANPATYTSAYNKITLGGFTLSITGNDGIAAYNIPIEGSGAVEYSGIDTLQMGGINTYSGTTSFVNVVKAYNTNNQPRSPSQMFGSSSISIDANSVVQLEFSAAGSFDNQITLSDTAVSGTQGGSYTTFNPQLYLEGQASSSFAIALTHIVLNGNGGIGYSSGLSTVDLAGIQANGHCLHVETTYKDKYLNLPTVCGGGSTSPPLSGVTPGVPNTGSHASHQNFMVAMVAFGAIIGVSSVVILKSRRATSSRH